MKFTLTYPMIISGEFLKDIEVHYGDHDWQPIQELIINAGETPEQALARLVGPSGNARTRGEFDLDEGWVESEERVPTQDDAQFGLVYVYYPRGLLSPGRKEAYAEATRWEYVAKNPSQYPYWHPLPKILR